VKEGCQRKEKYHSNTAGVKHRMKSQNSILETDEGNFSAVSLRVIFNCMGGICAP
jgi:hypothetical protein